MEYRKLVTIRDEADTLVENGVRKYDELAAALPILIELQGALEAARRNFEATRKVAKQLSFLCTKYAKEHPAYVFDDGKFHQDQNGVNVGDVTIDGKTYHLACGYKGYERVDGALMTQEFIETLPQNWRKVKNELSVTGVNDDNPTAEDLAKYGLAERPHNVWSERKDPKGIE